MNHTIKLVVAGYSNQVMCYVPSRRIRTVLKRVGR
jgi:hypothetical protein